MSKKKNLVNLDRDTREKIRGFEELAEQLLDEQIERGTKISKEKVDDTFELYQFLDSEDKRIEKVNRMLTTKLDNFKKHSQEEKIYQKVQVELVNTRQNLVVNLAHEDNNIHQQIQEMFRRLF
jgi:hypothetical protein